MSTKRYGKTAGGLSRDPAVNPLIARMDALEVRRLRRREEIREALHELWPSFFPISERITRAEVEVDRLKKVVGKRRAVKP